MQIEFSLMWTISLDRVTFFMFTYRGNQPYWTIALNFGRIFQNWYKPGILHWSGKYSIWKHSLTISIKNEINFLEAPWWGCKKVHHRQWLSLTSSKSVPKLLKKFSWLRVLLKQLVFHLNMWDLNLNWALWNNYDFFPLNYNNLFFSLT